jgi:hypothetical protein
MNHGWINTDWEKINRRKRREQRLIFLFFDLDLVGFSRKRSECGLIKKDREAG